MIIAGMILYFLLTLGFITFTAGYIWSTGGLIHGGWRRTEAGRMIASLGGSCSWVLLLGWISLVWPDYPGRPLVRLVSFSLLVAVVWWMVSLLWRRQLARRRQERSGDELQVQAGGLDDHDSGGFERGGRPR